MDAQPIKNHKIRRGETLIGLLRHGITLWNEEKRIQGTMDSPLSAHGRAKTASWVKQLREYRWDRIVASDLGRVQETVAILNETLGLPTHFDKRLREIDWGDWEGLTMKTVSSDYAELLDKLVMAGWAFRAPGGESRREAWQRANDALLESISRWEGERILVVCHMGIIKCLICDITGSSFLPNETPAIGKESLQILSYADKALTCRQLNVSFPSNG